MRTWSTTVRWLLPVSDTSKISSEFFLKRLARLGSLRSSSAKWPRQIRTLFFLNMPASTDGCQIDSVFCDLVLTVSHTGKNFFNVWNFNLIFFTASGGMGSASTNKQTKQCQQRKTPTTTPQARLAVLLNSVLHCNNSSVHEETTPATNTQTKSYLLECPPDQRVR